MGFYLACCATTCLVYCFEHLCLFVMMEYGCICVCGLLRPRRKEVCCEGNRCCYFFAQVVSGVKAGNCLLTMPDNRCFLAFLFWLVIEGEGT